MQEKRDYIYVFSIIAIVSIVFLSSVFMYKLNNSYALSDDKDISGMAGECNSCYRHDHCSSAKFCYDGCCKVLNCNYNSDCASGEYCQYKGYNDPVSGSLKGHCARKCTDTDGGVNKDRKGTVNYYDIYWNNYEDATDSCSGNILTEYSCNSDGRYFRSKSIDCTQSANRLCVDGACVANSNPVTATCIDTNPINNKFMPGKVYGVDSAGNPYSFEDDCDLKYDFYGPEVVTYGECVGGEYRIREEAVECGYFTADSPFGANILRPCAKSDWGGISADFGPACACGKDSECGPGYRCANHQYRKWRCEPISASPQCTQNSDCPSGQICTNGQCVANTQTCNPPCQAGYTCQQNSFGQYQCVYTGGSSGCTDECSQGQTRCSSTGSIVQTCGNYDSDSCLEYPSSTTGAGNAQCYSPTPICSGGACASQPTNTRSVAINSNPSGAVVYISVNSDNSNPMIVDYTPLTANLEYGTYYFVFSKSGYWDKLLPGVEINAGSAPYQISVDLQPS